MRFKHSVILAAIATLSVGTASMLLPRPALAALGGSADSVGADTTVLRGQMRSTPEVQYDVQEITSGAVTVHEYVTRSGQVFAITWQGPVPPNLRQLLGSYFDRLQSAATAARQHNPGMHRRFSVAQSDFVMQSVGRLRDFRGIAYVPALVPAGVTVSELQ